MGPAAWKLLGLLGLLAGGTGLGAVLSTFVDPVPRQREPGPTQLSARPEFSGAQSYRFVEVGPEDLSPPGAPDSHAPEWADDDEGVWQYPEPALAAWEPAPYPSMAELDAQLAEDAALLAASKAVTAPAEPSPAPAVAEAPTRRESRLAGLY